MQTMKMLATSLSLALIMLDAGNCEGATVKIDYTYDSFKFFGAMNPGGAAAGDQARAAIEAAASFLSGILDDSLSPIQTPSPYHSATQGGVATWHWSLGFSNPSTGAQVTLNDVAIPVNEYRVYVGARSLGSDTLGTGGPGISNFSYNWSGGFTVAQAQQRDAINASFQSAVFDRGESTGFANWGGALSFNRDIASLWHFDHTTAPVSNDFYSVALHELVHALGFGAGDEWTNLATGSAFGGLMAAAEFGSPPPLENPNPFRSHWQSSTMSRVLNTSMPQEALMDPQITTGTRKLLTALDAAALVDIGWEIEILPPPPPADFDGSGIVDSGDLATWKTSFGPTVGADADGDGRSGGSDFLAWQRGMGATMSSGGAPVPEVETGLALALGVALPLLGVIRPGHRRALDRHGAPGSGLLPQRQASQYLLAGCRQGER